VIPRLIIPKTRGLSNGTLFDAVLQAVEMCGFWVMRSGASTQEDLEAFIGGEKG